MPSIKKEDSKIPVNLTAVFKGILVAMAICLLLSIGTGVFYHATLVSEGTLLLFTVFIIAVSVLSGALAAGKEAGNKGLYNGLAVGLIFFLVIWLFSELIMPGQSMLNIIYKLLITLSAGAAGGIIGVGLS